jgi:hypothetical protein
MLHSDLRVIIDVLKGKFVDNAPWSIVYMCFCQQYLFAVQTTSAPLFRSGDGTTEPKYGWEWRFCLLVEGVESSRVAAEVERIIVQKKITILAAHIELHHFSGLLWGRYNRA